MSCYSLYPQSRHARTPLIVLFIPRKILNPRVVRLEIVVCILLVSRGQGSRYLPSAWVTRPKPLLTSLHLVASPLIVVSNLLPMGEMATTGCTVVLATVRWTNLVRSTPQVESSLVNLVHLLLATCAPIIWSWRGAPHCPCTAKFFLVACGASLSTGEK